MGIRFSDLPQIVKADLASADCLAILDVSADVLKKVNLGDIYSDSLAEYESTSSFPETGQAKKIYLALDTNKIYRWDTTTTAYVEISKSLELGDTSTTAFAGNRGKAIEDVVPSGASTDNLLATTTDLAAKQNVTLSTPIVVDETSYTTVEAAMNAINNKAVTVTVDDAMSTTSTNPVQNKVITEALDGKANVERVSRYGNIWDTKTWSGLTDFSSSRIWSDGTNIYYSRDTNQYVLDKSTSTWSTKTWLGLTSFRGSRTWSDGTNIYYSNDTSQYVLDRSEEAVIEDSIIVKSNGDLQGIGEIYDDAGNVLSEKFDANSFVLQKFRVTVTASSWSSSQTSGYYTYALTLPYPINTYKEFSMGLTGSADGTDPTAAESAAYSLVNYFDANDGTGVTSATLRAKTKPSTTFYIMISGYYMQKNAATSGVALDIKTANKLKIYDANSNSYDFDGSSNTYLNFINDIVTFAASGWSSTVGSDGYYTNTSIISHGINTYNDVRVRLIGNDKNTAPTAEQIAAYNLIDLFYMNDSTNTALIFAKAKNRPTSHVKVLVSGTQVS